jgi:hypothetical protein
MATTTPNYGWPVPTSTDYVKDGATAIEALGDAIDATVFGLGTGLTLVKTQTIGAAVSSVTVTGAFSTTYDAYKIIVSGGVGSAATFLQLKLGAAATNYDNATFGVSTAGSFSGGFSQNDTSFNVAAVVNTNFIDVNLDLINPFLTKFTLASGDLRRATIFQRYVGLHKTADSYTAFTLTPETGTITGGTIRVYGYKNS